MTLEERLVAQLYHDVPSAFWLDPKFWEGTKWADPAPPPPPPPPPPPARKLDPLPRWLRQLTWEGIPIKSATYAHHDMTFRLLLEDGQAVTLTEAMVRDHFRWSLM